MCVHNNADSVCVRMGVSMCARVHGCVRVRMSCGGCVLKCMYVCALACVCVQS